MTFFAMSQRVNSQYTHFNMQYPHKGGFHLAECFEDSVQVYAMTYQGASGTIIRRTTVNYLGDQLTTDEVIFPNNVGIPVFNPNEIILHLSEEKYISLGADLECGEHDPCIGSFDQNMNLNWSFELTDWLDCSTNSFYPGGLAKIDDTHFAMVTNVRIQIDGQLDQFGYRLAIFDGDGNEEEQYTYFREDIPYNTIFGLEKIEGGYLIWGDCSGPQDNGLSCSPDIINYVLHTNEIGLGDEIYFLEDDDFVWDGYLAMELLPNDKALGIYGYNTEMDCDIWKVKAKPRAVLIDLNTMLPVWDSYLEIPELSDIWIGAMHVKDIVQASNSGFVATIQIQQDVSNVYTLVLKVSSSGELDWYRILDAPSNPTETYVQSLIGTPDGGYLIGGYTNDGAGPMWLVKLDACGYEVESGCPAVIGIEENEKEQSTFWPNPMLNTLHAKLAPTVSRIEISDMSGRVVFDDNAYFPRQQWDLKTLSPGMYNVRTIHDDGSFEGTVVVKE